MKAWVIVGMKAMSHDTWLFAGNCVELNISNLWSPNHEYLKCLSLSGCFANVETFFSVFFIQLALSFFFDKWTSAIRRFIAFVPMKFLYVIPLLINIFIVPLNVVLDFSVKFFQVMKSSWLASLKCLSLFFLWLFCSCPVALKFWTCHRNSTLWPLVFRFLCARNELVYC